jgi:hypothetical protein
MRAREVSMAIWANESNGRRIRLLDLKNQREAEYIAWHLADASEMRTASIEMCNGADG